MGNGTAGFSGDGGLALSASLNYPMGLTADPSGNVYVADCNNGRIRKINCAKRMAYVVNNATVADSGTYRVLKLPDQRRLRDERGGEPDGDNQSSHFPGSL